MTTPEPVDKGNLVIISLIANREGEYTKQGQR
jgi:hypothetical protein